MYYFYLYYFKLCKDGAAVETRFAGVSEKLTITMVFSCALSRKRLCRVDF